MYNRSLLTAAAATTVVVAAFAAVSTFRHAKENPVLTIIGINKSQSDRPALPTSIHTAKMVFLHLKNAGDRLFTLGVDDQTTEIYAGPIAGTPDGFEALLVDQLGTVSQHDGTPTELFWREVEKKVNATDLPVVIHFETDGASELTTSAGHDEIHAIATRLAKRPNLFVVIQGPDPATWSEISSDLGPLRSALGDRFEISVDRSPVRVLRQIDAARNVKRSESR